MSWIRRLSDELGRRSLWRILGIYIAGGWLLLQVIDQLGQNDLLPGWAYRAALVALLAGIPVLVLTALLPSGAPESETAPYSQSGLRRILIWRNVLLGGLAIFSVLAVSSAAWLIRDWGSAAESATSAAGEAASPIADAELDRRRPSIAVLPFENLSPDESNQFFADGVHEDVLANLSRIGGLRVISRTSVLEYRNPQRNLREIAQELGVAVILEGSARRDGDQVRVVAQLIDASTDEHLWAATYDRTLTDIFAVQSDIARQIADSLHAELSPDEERRIQTVPTTDLAAYALYQRSRTFNPGDPSENDSARQLLRQAIAMDSAFAEAYARLAYLWSWRVTLGDPTAGDSTLAIVASVLALNPDLADAHHALGRHYSWIGNYSEADAAFRTALEVDPNHAGAMTDLALSLLRRSRADEALLWITRARSREPTNALVEYFLGLSLVVLHERDRAERWLRAASSRHPDDSWPLTLLMQLDLEFGDTAAAAERMGAIRRRFPENRDVLMQTSDVAMMTDPIEARRLLEPFYLEGPEGESFHYFGRTYRTHYAWALWATGDLEEAAALFDDALAWAEAEYARGNQASLLLFELASIQAMRGEIDQAFAWLERANEEGFAMLPLLLNDPLLDGIKDDPRFAALIDEMRERLTAMRARIDAADAWPQESG